MKLSTDAAVHAALALLLGGIAGLLLWGLRAAGLDPLPAAGALTGTAIFASRELAQAPYKRSGTVNHKEWIWPAIACGMAAVVATSALALL